MAQEHLNSLITSTGLEAADIEAILALPDEGDQDLTPYTGKIAAATQTQIKNDPAFWEGLDETNVNPILQKKIEAQQYGRAVNITRQKLLKASGLKEEDLGEMSEEEKRNLEFYAGKTFEKYASSKVSDKQLQADLLEARKKYEDLETNIPTREAEIKQEFDVKFNDKVIDFAILAELAAVENLKVPASYVIDKIAASLKNENAFVIDGLKASPKQKSNPNLDVLDGSKALTLKDLIVKKLTADGLIAEPAAPGRQQGTTRVDVEPDGKGNLGISGHILDKIKENTPPA